MTTPPSEGFIVVGVDGSASSVAALRWAIAQAAPGQHVRVISAYGWSDGVHAHMSRADAEVNISAAFDAIGGVEGIHLEQTVVEGEPVEALLSQSESALLLVVGRHGTRGMIHSALASVGDTCSRMAACPVVIVPA